MFRLLSPSYLLFFWLSVTLICPVRLNAGLYEAYLAAQQAAKGASAGADTPNAYLGSASNIGNIIKYTMMALQMGAAGLAISASAMSFHLQKKVYSSYEDMERKLIDRMLPAVKKILGYEGNDNFLYRINYDIMDLKDEDLSDERDTETEKDFVKEKYKYLNYLKEMIGHYDDVDGFCKDHMIAASSQGSSVMLYALGSGVSTAIKNKDANKVTAKNAKLITGLSYIARSIERCFKELLYIREELEGFHHRIIGYGNMAYGFGRFLNKSML